MGVTRAIFRRREAPSLREIRFRRSFVKTRPIWPLRMIINTLEYLNKTTISRGPDLRRSGPLSLISFYRNSLVSG